MIKISIVGKGKMAIEHLKVLNQIKNVKISSILVRNINKNYKLPKIFSQLNIYNNLDQMISSENPDGIVVAVTETSLFQLFKKLVKHKMPLLIEKPIGYNLNQNKKIINLMKKFKKKKLLCRFE